MAFGKILIANRGEIACRVIRTARELGYRTVAVYSQADARAPHVSLADEAVLIGPPPAADSYLRIDAILDAARRTGADAVHPGYGFLSENPIFARECATHNITFIGPPVEAIEIMGDKSRAKARMVEAGVPVVPGAAIASVESAEKLGFPVMVKAVSGGGGRGMRLVQDAIGLPEALSGAAREALSAFGDGRLMLEKFVRHGRHIEFQIFGDSHGNCVHLGERDCTAQRRRQKVVEESPSPIVDSDLRARMAEAAVKAARAVDYRGAGTVEFILDAEGNFYFLEMNTRLQVEHPVTECVTGLDLVAWQLIVASGEPLPLRQDEIRFSGHAIEARLCAEDPYEKFAPQTGVICYWRPEQAALRVDAGVVKGSEVSPYYDSLLAKFVAHGATRQDAIRRLVAALGRAPMFGVATNAGFLMRLLQSTDFTQARMHTGSIDESANDEILRRPSVSASALALATCLLVAPADGFRNRGSAAYGMTLHTPSGAAQVRVTVTATDVVVVTGECRKTVRVLSREWPDISFEIDGVRHHALAMFAGATLHLSFEGEVLSVSEASPLAAREQQINPLQIITPVAGNLLSLLTLGTVVGPGDVVAVIEAMKIETRIYASVAATVSQVFVTQGGQVTAKKLLAALSPLEAVG
jgi:acetyl-CoA carboxylase biotin carboxylase subunit